MPLNVRPTATLRVGVTGHRAGRLAPNTEAELSDTLASVFTCISQECDAFHFEDQHPGTGRRLYSADPPVVVLVSGLATGADILAAESTSPNIVLDAVIPFPISTYLRDFEPAANAGQTGWRDRFEASLSKARSATVLPETGLTATSYVSAAELLLNNIDLLVAVWDGAAGRGPGGTQWVISSAYQRGLPVLWIRLGPDRLKRPEFLVEIDPEGGPISENVDARVGPIRKVVHSQLSIAEADDERPDLLALQTFYSEASNLDHYKRTYATAYKNLLNLANSVLPQLSVSCDDVSSEVADAEFSMRMSVAAPRLASVIAILHERRKAADTLATFYAHRYRSAYVMAYLLSCIAVLLALCGMFAYDENHHLLLLPKAVLGLAEIVIIVSILLIVRSGTRKKWHERWIQCRALAERLRHFRFLWPLGIISRGSSAALGSRSDWVSWYLKAIQRQVGLPGTVLNADLCWKLLDAVDLVEITPQIDYHLKNSRRLHKLERFLHVAGVVCFTGTLATLIAFVAWLTVQTITLPSPTTRLAYVSAIITLIVAFLPTLGASLAGIRYTGDFEGFAEHSQSTYDQLQQLKASLEARKVTSASSTAEFLDSVASALAQDVTEWHSIYRRKRLQLPA